MKAIPMDSLKSCTTNWTKIFMAGDLATAKNVCRQFTFKEGLCVTIEPTSYIYTGGEEAGFVVGFINYPRFPNESLCAQLALALQLAHELLDACSQWSFSIMTPTETHWYTRRPSTKLNA
jgi:hypothetical protein